MEQYLASKYSFEGVCVLDTEICPTTWHIQAAVSVPEEANEFITLRKVHYFFNAICNGSIFVSSENQWAMTAFEKTSNNIVLFPDEPIIDPMVAMVFQTKMNALAEEGVEFGVVEIENSLSGGLVHTLSGNGSEFLPSITSWLGKRNYFEVPWWSRNDGSTIDRIPADHEQIPGTIPPYAISLDFLKDFDDDDERESAKVIPFRPHVIRGGAS